MTSARRALLLWCALVIAFSPVLHDLGTRLRDEPDQRYILLPLLLIALLLAHSKSGNRSNAPDLRLGAALLVLGVLAQTFGIASGTSLISRLGLPLGVLGVACLTGRPDPRILALSFALVPIPDSIKHATSPFLESMLGGGAARILSALGLPLQTGGPLFQYHGARLELQPSDSGIVTLALLGEFGWYRAVRAGRTLARSLQQALGWALLTILVQPVVVLIGLAMLPIGWPEVGRFLLTHGVTIAIASVVIVGHIRGLSIPTRNRPQSATGS